MEQNKIFAAQFLGKIMKRVLLLNGSDNIVWVSDFLRDSGEYLPGTEENFYSAFPGVPRGPLYEEQTVTHGGKTYTFEIHAFDDGSKQSEKIVFLHNVQDLSDSSNKIYCFNKILDSLNDGVIMSDLTGKVTLYNSAMEKLEGLRSRDVLGKWLGEVYGYKNPDYSEHRNVMRTGIAIVEKYRAHAVNEGVPQYVTYSTYPIEVSGCKIGAYSVCQNETKLHAMLRESIELRRKYVQESSVGGINDDTPRANGTFYTFSDIVGTSESTVGLIHEAQSLALLNNNILIIGETGTGKEVFAQSIHNFRKSDEPFIAINCAAIPDNLFESILFGSVKGAYTGALDHRGLFEEAGAGTLFLDELNSMPVALQTKLLRALQERKIRRVGGITAIPIRCRFISAVNKDPQNLISSGILRQDLFYRIAASCLYIEPIRNRREDLYVLADFFIKRYNRLMNKRVKTMSDELTALVINYGWPGNVREFEHFIENIMVRAGESQSQLDLKDVPGYLMNTMRVSVSTKETVAHHDKDTLNAVLHSVEEKMIREALVKNNWNISKSARDLGIIRQSILYRMKRLGIAKE